MVSSPVENQLTPVNFFFLYISGAKLDGHWGTWTGCVKAQKGLLDFKSYWAFTGRVSFFAFASLIGITVSITSSAGAIRIKMYKSIIEKDEKLR